MPSNEYVSGSAYDRYVDYSSNYFTLMRDSIRSDPLDNIEPAEPITESPPERKMPNVVPHLS